MSVLLPSMDICDAQPVSSTRTPGLLLQLIFESLAEGAVRFSWYAQPAADEDHISASVNLLNNDDLP
jgi:hypothetical protein